MEDPGYGPPRRLFRTLGLRVSGVPVDQEGLVVDSIPPATRLVYVSPSHQFPLGLTMSLRRRIALAAWADRTGGAIIEDDYDSEFRFADRPIEPIKSARPGRIGCSSSDRSRRRCCRRCGSGTSIVPRSIGYTVEVAKYLADWHSPTGTQAAMAWFLSNGSLRPASPTHAHRVPRGGIAGSSTHSHRDFTGLVDVVPSSVGLHLAALATDGSVDRIEAVHRRSTSVGRALPTTRPIRRSAIRHARGSCSVTVPSRSIGSKRACNGCVPRLLAVSADHEAELSRLGSLGHLAVAASTALYCAPDAPCPEKSIKTTPSPSAQMDKRPSRFARCHTSRDRRSLSNKTHAAHCNMRSRPITVARRVGQPWRQDPHELRGGRRPKLGSSVCQVVLDRRVRQAESVGGRLL